jgi:thiol-disulfide isomerase/thioredoxin
MGYVKIKGSILLAGLLFAGRLFAQPPAATLPVFKFSASDHRTVTNTDLPRDKPVLFVFVDPDCDHCQHAARNMDEKYNAFEKAAVYFVTAASPEQMKLFAKKYAPRLSGMRNVCWLQDIGNQFITRFRPIRFPSFFLYSTENKLLDYEDNEDTIFRVIRCLEKNAK